MSKNISACLSHNSDDWRTPTPLFNAFMKKGFHDCFPYLADYDELKNCYYGKKLFINPPFSLLRKMDMRLWLMHTCKHNQVALLIPSRTDTMYFRDLLKYHPYIIFIRGRLKYNDSNSAPFPSLLLVFNFYCSRVIGHNSLDQEELIQFIDVCL